MATAKESFRKPGSVTLKLDDGDILASFAVHGDFQGLDACVEGSPAAGVWVAVPAFCKSKREWVDVVKLGVEKQVLVQEPAWAQDSAPSLREVHHKPRKNAPKPFKLFEGGMDDSKPVGETDGYYDWEAAEKDAQCIADADGTPVMIHDAKGVMLATVQPCTPPPTVEPFMGPGVFGSCPAPFKLHKGTPGSLTQVGASQGYADLGEAESEARNIANKDNVSVVVHDACDVLVEVIQPGSATVLRPLGGEIVTVTPPVGPPVVDEHGAVYPHGTNVDDLGRICDPDGKPRTSRGVAVMAAKPVAEGCCAFLEVDVSHLLAVRFTVNAIESGEVCVEACSHREGMALPAKGSIQESKVLPCP